MKVYGRFENSKQMAVSVAVFAALMLVLESGGLYDWAQRLDLGAERSVAIPVTSALHRGLAWTGLERVRGRELTELARAGWSDDAGAVAASRMDGKPLAPAPTVQGVVTFIAEPSAVPPPMSVAPLTPMLPLKPMAGDPPIASALPALSEVPLGKTRTVALTGDSMMAVGLSSTLLREAPQYKDLVFVRTFKSGTGLARPEVFNWQTEYPAMLKAALADAKPDVIVVAIGANDGQGFVEGGVTYPFGTTEWQALYQRRVQAFLALLEKDGATVVWVGLPPMKSGAYDARIALVNRIDYAVVSAAGTRDGRAVWFSSAGLVGDASGRFQDYGRVRGVTARLRQQDGIHLSDDGAELLAEKLLPWLAKQESAPAVRPSVKETASSDVARSGVITDPANP